LKVNKLSSIEDPFPLDYYRLPFCEPVDGIKVKNENLGEFLVGDKIESSPYIFEMTIDKYCQQLCISNIGRGEGEKPEKGKKGKGRHRRISGNKFVRAIRRGYNNNWIVDNLPSAFKMEVENNEKNTRYGEGFPVGFVDKQTSLSYVHNHVNLELQYHKFKGKDGDDESYRIVGFTVEPFSIAHNFERTLDEEEGTQSTAKATINHPIDSCSNMADNQKRHTAFDMIQTPQKASGQVLFTYDVIWSENEEVQWSTRWDVYLNMNHTYPTRIHWLSIANSMVIVFVLSAMIAAILIRNLRRDMARYSSVPTEEERADDLEEFGWKLVHADVFRSPSYPMLIASFCGSGMQILCMSIFTIFFGWLGFLSPSRRGQLLISLLVSYVLMGFIAGFTAARIYKTFKGKSWQKTTMVTAIGFPGFAFTIFFIMNLLAVSQESVDAVPFHTMFTMLFLWFGISSPLVFFGAFLGFKKDAIEFPVNTSNIPRQIPDQPWFMGTIPTLIIGGIMPFGSCFLELYFMMSSVWQHQYYYVFGILLVVFFILLLTCAEIAILYTYFQLCGEDYQWWWRSFTTAGSTALYVFGYSIFYFKQLEANTFASYVLYFGYMALVSFMIFLMTGTVGLLSSLHFNKTIYASIKID